MSAYLHHKPTVLDSRYKDATVYELVWSWIDIPGEGWHRAGRHRKAAFRWKRSEAGCFNMGLFLDLWADLPYSAPFLGYVLHIELTFSFAIELLLFLSTCCYKLRYGIFGIGWECMSETQPFSRIDCRTFTYLLILPTRWSCRFVPGTGIRRRVSTSKRPQISSCIAHQKTPCHKNVPAKLGKTRFGCPSWMKTRNAKQRRFTTAVVVVGGQLLRWTSCKWQFLKMWNDEAPLPDLHGQFDVQSSYTNNEPDQYVEFGGKSQEGTSVPWNLGTSLVVFRVFFVHKLSFLCDLLFEGEPMRRGLGS